MLRHDTAQVLEEKLKVIPRDINELYDQLLNSLEPDERERAIKMLLLAVHNPFSAPLNSVAFAWIDDLNDPQFPPCDGKKPPSWPPFNEINENVQLQLKSLTKGLLEATPMTNSFEPVSRMFEMSDPELDEIFGPMREVRFFHRTVRGFVLEKLESTTRQYPGLINVETYHRLWLAELTLAELPYRLMIWYRDIWKVGVSRFQEELPPELLRGFSCVLDNGQDTMSENVKWPKTFRGIYQRIDHSWWLAGSLSFVHMAAYTGQQEYVFQEILKNPKLLHATGELNLLLSAALGDRKYLVQALLERGSSPTDSVVCESGGKKRPRVQDPNRIHPRLDDRDMVYRGRLSNQTRTRLSV
ncbi:hypothetical protein GP486_004224 [Trichoglossum hirsutum]|uniref:DUF7791 domain-containing protein n=1 Tax=Trichoglossum hirsutum TaxID=265104 RepID=A0A9P8RQ18_9PEZI|nr:hypothetical protein GP486_004224 [Trichoglossum hirsutum]